MASSDRNQCIQVTLRLEDWATVVTALALSTHAPLVDKERINSTIFESAKQTERILS
jgi:hypothetical protein